MKAFPFPVLLRANFLQRIVPGSMVLGQVSKINAHDIALSIPNNLIGYIPLTSVSKILNRKIEKLLDDDDTSDGGHDLEDDTEQDTIDLKDYFYLGQYLRAYVVSTEADRSGGSSRSKKRIELSVDPEQANSGLTKSDLLVDSAVQA